MTVMLLSMVMSLVALTFGQAAKQTPERATEPIEASAIPLDGAILYPPVADGGDDDAADTTAVQVLIHFHGDPQFLLGARHDAGLDGVALIVVNRNGFSSVYREAVADPEQIATWLRTAGAALNQESDSGHFDHLDHFDTVWLSCFSAGYGAVRKVLRSPETAARIDGVVCADAMYAGYAEDGTVLPEDVGPFVTYAQRAAAGEVRFVVTHSYLAPGTYAGTHETAAVLLDEVELSAMPAGGVTYERSRGRFWIEGWSGDTGEAHGAHLGEIARAWARLGEAVVQPQVEP